MKCAGFHSLKSWHIGRNGSFSSEFVRDYFKSNLILTFLVNFKWTTAGHTAPAQANLFVVIILHIVLKKCWVVNDVMEANFASSYTF